jgi:hypothetical protein
MRALLYLALLGAAIAGYIWVVQRLKESRALASRPAPAQIPARPADPDEPATLAFGPDTGPGRLRLGRSQLVFTADSGRVIVIELLDITGVSASRELPDRTLVHDVLVVSAGSHVYYFMVDSPAAWERWLTRGR